MILYSVGFKSPTATPDLSRLNGRFR